MKTKKTIWLSYLAICMACCAALAQTTEIRGLTVLVEYTDAPFVESEQSVALMLNQPGFVGWGNEGSVRDFFYTQSNGKVLITSTVIKVSLPNTVDYYFEEGKGSADLVNAINQKYPAGFQNLSLNPNGSLVHFCAMSKADKGAWAFGPQPGTHIIKNNGQNATIGSGNIVTYGRNQTPEVNVVCHEMGHNVMEWPDHYATAWSNLGNYCAMASAGNTKGPQQINPALRLQKGWIDHVIEIGHLTHDETYTAVANSYNTIYKYTNPYNPKEYLLIHPQVYGKYHQQFLNTDAVADQGLAIYYVDEDGGMDLGGDELDFQVKLLQADNQDEMHTEHLRFSTKKQSIRGDFDDLYDNVRNSFPNSTPFRWKDGGEFGLSIGEISAPGPTMDFTVYARTGTYLALSDKNGSISPKGVISSTSQTFTLLPYPGYEVNQVKVNGQITAVSGNILNVNGAGTKTIEVTYKRKVVLDPLPAPWQHVDIGNAPVAGVSGQTAGKFYLESFGHDVWGTSDNFRFVYQTMNGDGEIVAKLASSNQPQRWSKAGLMIRESLQSNAAYSWLMFTPRNFVRVQQRAVANTNSVDDPNNNDNREEHLYNAYKWFKITRVGNVITSSCSYDKLSWFQIAQQTISMGAQVYVGMAVTGALSNYPVRAEFDNVAVTSTAPNNLRPIVFLSSPSNNASYVAPASVTINATASDVDGTIAKVEFFNGSTLLGTDFTAPFTFTWTNVSAGNYTITAKATDNRGAFTSSEVVAMSVGASIADLSGPACGSNNAALTFELSAAKRANATGFNWYFTGSAQSITPVAGQPYKSTLLTGNYFGSGQLCVGVNYSASPWYSAYCVTVAKCVSAREGDFGFTEVPVSGLSFQSPFSGETVVILPETNTSATVQVFDAKGALLATSTETDSFRFGSDLKAGLYVLKINIDGKIETIRLIKQ